MKKISSKIFAVIFCCAFLVAVMLGGMSIFESSKLLKKDAEDMLSWMAASYADKFSVELSVIEDKLQEIEIFIKNTIDYEKLKSDPEYLAEYEKILAPFIKDFADKRTKSIAGWVYFDPKWSTTPHDVYYVDGNGDGLADRQKYIPFSYYDNTPKGDDDKQWWYGPIEKGGTFWTNPYEWKLINNEVIKVVSCASPLYINGEFICVIGTYYRFDAVMKDIENIKVYENGYATLFNEKLDVVVHPKFKSGTRFTSDNFAAVDNGKFREISKQMLKNNNGLAYYIDDSGKDSAFAYSKLSNGWVLAVDPLPDEMYAGIYELFYELLGAIVACILLSLIAAFAMGKFISKPILKVAEAAKIIGTGNLDITVSVDTNDEIKILADSLNSMTSNIKSLQSQLVKQAYYDELTGIRNLNKFKIDAAELIKSNSHLNYIVIKLDIDRFKLLNEIYGYEMCDNLLIAFSNALSQSLDANNDIYARITADEFILLVSFEDDEMPARIAEYFAKIIPDKINIRKGRYCIEQGETDFSAIFEKVNFAHRLAKQNGSLICNYDDEIKTLALKRKDIENKMEAALQNGEFKIFLQPKYFLSDEMIAGAEALVRWKFDGKDIQYPGSFIPLFEQNGFITKLDMYMFEQACRIIRGWIDDGKTPVVISVNFSRLHLNNKSFVDELSGLADKYNVAHNLLEIEITETAIFDNVEILENVLVSLHDAGFTLSMDDFGTGYSSLGLLKNIPVDVIKIDKSFFDENRDNERAKAVIGSVMDMSKRLGVHTVAEGVETKENVDMLRDLGCDIVQGYYYAKPMPAEEFVPIL